MTENFDFGDSPYRWDEFRRFMEWWRGPRLDVAEVQPDQVSLLASAAPLERFHREIGWSNHDSHEPYADLYPPKLEEQTHGDLLVFGRMNQGSGFLAADLTDPDLAVYSALWCGLDAPRDWYEIMYLSLEEALIKCTMSNLVASRSRFNLGLEPHPHRPSDPIVSPQQALGEAVFLLDAMSPRDQDSRQAHTNLFMQIYLYRDTLLVCHSDAPERQSFLEAFIRPQP